jgi:hypothetical protein
MLIGVKVQDLHAQQPDSMYGQCCALHIMRRMGMTNFMSHFPHPICKKCILDLQDLQVG